MSADTDTIPEHLWTIHCADIVDALHGRPIPRHCAVLISTDSDPWVTTQTELCDHFATSGMGITAKRFRRLVVPTNHVLAVIVETTIRWKLVDMSGAADTDEDEPAAMPSGASALGVLGAFGGSR